MAKNLTAFILEPATQMIKAVIPSRMAHIAIQISTLNYRK